MGNTYWVLCNANDTPRKFIGVFGWCLDWTEDLSQALRLARREDCDKLAELVEDAWRSLEYSGEMEVGRGTWDKSRGRRGVLIS